MAGAFEQAWSLLKALPGQQITDTAGDMRTVDPIIARLARESADPLGLAPQVTLQGNKSPKDKASVRPGPFYGDDNYNQFIDEYGNPYYRSIHSRFSPGQGTRIDNPFSPYHVKYNEMDTPHHLLREGLRNATVASGTGVYQGEPSRYRDIEPEQVVNPRHYPFDTPMDSREPNRKLLEDSAKFNYAVEQMKI